MCESHTLTRNVSVRDAGKLIRPLRRDPTGTTAIQRQFLREIVKRTNKLNRAIYDLIVHEDAFGLNDASPQDFRDFIQTNRRFKFETNAKKLAAFRQWLMEQINLGILEIDPAASTPGAGWVGKFIRSAYKKAAVTAYTKVRSSLSKTKDFVAGSTAEFLAQAFDSPIALDRIELLATRAFEQLKGVTDQMSAQLNRVLADGLAHGRGPREIAREIDKQIGNINRTRAVRIARTEIVHTYAEGSLDSYERLGVEEVGVLAEWSTAGDDRVCPQCAPLENVIMSTQEARGLIPLHPNCRCAWIPALDDRKSPRLRGKKSPHPKRRQKALKQAEEAGADL